MPKLEITIEPTYRRMARHTADIRTVLRDSVHQPEERATTRTLFAIGVAAVAIGGGVLILVR